MQELGCGLTVILSTSVYCMGFHAPHITYLRVSYTAIGNWILSLFYYLLHIKQQILEVYSKASDLSSLNIVRSESHIFLAHLTPKSA